LTASRPTTPTSPSCRSARQPNPGRGSTYRRGNSVQRFGTTAVYANVIAPLVSLIALGRAFYLLKQSEQDDLRDLIAPALKGLTRGGASVLLITVVPAGFLVHLSCGIVISLAHGYVWDKGNENKEMIFNALKKCLGDLRNARAELQVPSGDSLPCEVMQNRKVAHNAPLTLVPCSISTPVQVP
jgi:hypothetical protein